MSPLDRFHASLDDLEPDPGLPPAVAGLWWARKGAWDRAHAIVQDETGPQAAWVHAYLHRVEGDPGNAAYWYRRAGRPTAGGSLDDEWLAIAAALLTASET